jgi:hypothetical protein
MWSFPWDLSKLPTVQKLLFPKVPAECRQLKGHWGHRSSDPPSWWHPWSSFKNFFSRMAWNMVLLRKPWTLPPDLHRLTPWVPWNLEWRTDSTWDSLGYCLDQQGQSPEGERIDRIMRRCPLAGPPSPAVEEASPPGLGVLWTPRPDLGNPREHNSRASGKASRRNIIGHVQLAGRRAGALLPHHDRKGSSKAPYVIHSLLYP